MREIPMETMCVEHLLCCGKVADMCSIRMRETLLCTKAKKIQKNSPRKIAEMRHQNVTYTVYGIDCAGEIFFSWYRSLTGKVLMFFSLKFRSLGGLVAESILRTKPLWSRGDPDLGLIP